MPPAARQGRELPLAREVPRRPGITEIIDLDAEAQARLITEITDVSRVLRDITHCDKLNVAALGKIVTQLHVHIVARSKSDVAWPRPVWGVAPAIAYGDNELTTPIEAVCRQLGLDQNE